MAFPGISCPLGTSRSCPLQDCSTGLLSRPPLHLWLSYRATTHCPQGPHHRITLQGYHFICGCPPGPPHIALRAKLPCRTKLSSRQKSPSRDKSHSRDRHKLPARQKLSFHGTSLPPWEQVALVWHKSSSFGTSVFP